MAVNGPATESVTPDSNQQIEPALAPGAVVSTSSSGLLLSDLQQGFADPSRLLLGHPYNPPHLIPLVELLVNNKLKQ